MKISVNTPYDDVFRTLLNDCSALIIPLVNEIFHESYSGQEAVEFYPNEHFVNRQDGLELERVTDSCFGIRGEKLKKYHIECQSTPDSTMLIRMFEYGSQIALDAGKVENGVLTVRFPNAAVLYLRCRASTPDLMTIRIELPGGEGNVSEYTIPVMKAQRYSPEEIFAKGLLFLIPFRIFSHEERFAEYEKDRGSLETLTAEYEGIKRHLETLSRSGKLTEYAKRTIEEMTGKVLEHIAETYDKVREGVKSVMGGNVLEYEAKTIFNEGLALGRNEGILMGRNEGILMGRNEGFALGEAKGKANTARNLLRMGLVPSQISEATGLSPDEIEALRDGPS